MYYSPSAGGFYVDGIHPAIPADGVEITQGRHDALMLAQSQGKIIRPDEHGAPVAVDAPVISPTVEQQILALEAQVTPRRVREALLGNTEWLAGQDGRIAALRSQL